MRTLAATLSLGAVLSTAVAAAAPPNPDFDPPLATEQHPLPLPVEHVRTLVELTCVYYPRFMVKQIDEGEIGAAQLPIVPTDAQNPKPRCQKENVSSERVVEEQDWSGYFSGAKGDYVFFHDADSVNGGIFFLVVSASDARKVFADFAYDQPHELTRNEENLTFRYKRRFTGDCSVPQDGAPCWSKIAAAIGQLALAPPDCARGYAEAKAWLARERCRAQTILRQDEPDCFAKALRGVEAQDWDSSPSVIAYDIEVIIDGSRSSVRPLGGEFLCYPAD